MYRKINNGVDVCTASGSLNAVCHFTEAFWEMPSLADPGNECHNQI